MRSAHVLQLKLIIGISRAVLTAVNLQLHDILTIWHSKNSKVK